MNEQLARKINKSTKIIFYKRMFPTENFKLKNQLKFLFHSYGIEENQQYYKQLNFFRQKWNFSHKKENREIIF